MQCLRVDPIIAMESGFVFFRVFFFLAHFYNGKDFSTDKTKTHSCIFVLVASQRFTVKRMYKRPSGIIKQHDNPLH